MGTSDNYRGIQDRLGRGEPVILDGAIATELQRQGVRGFRLSDADHWGFDAIDHSPAAVAAVHRAYIESGANIVTTNTYGILDVPFGNTRAGQHWLDLSREAITLARDAADPAQAAVAFSIGGDIVSEAHLTTIRLLLRQFEHSAPDLVLFETLSMMTDNRTREAIALLVEAGLPVWLSFRRCRYGVCGIHGQLWGGREGDYFGRLSREMQDLGAGAILVNCLPVEMISGTLPWLRDFTDLPLGAYPNLGRYVDPVWRFDEDVSPEDYADMALMWRAEGAQILGGCCGTGPAYIRALAAALAGTAACAPIGSGQERASASVPSAGPVEIRSEEPWRDVRGRPAWPLQFPHIECAPAVYIPTEGSFFLWKYLFNQGVGAGERCLDIGCGTGLLGVQLALNGAKSVTSIDIQEEAVTNTLANAFRNGVRDCVDARVADLYALPAMDPFDVVVASLLQLPTDPSGQLSGHRPVDFWGRNLVDQLIAMLPRLLKSDGVAFVMQSSLLSRDQTIDELGRCGLSARVLDFEFDRLPAVFMENMDQIRRVEAVSDAYHFDFNDESVMVMYLLEIARS